MSYTPNFNESKVGAKTYSLLALTAITALFAGSAFASFSVNSAAQLATPYSVPAEPVSQNLEGISVSIKERPDPNVVVANSSVEVGRFSIRTYQNEANISSVSFQIQNPDSGIVGGIDEAYTLYLYHKNSATALGSVAITSPTSTIVFTDQLDPFDKQDYVVKAKFAQLNDASPAQSGAGLRWQMTNVNARDDNNQSLPVYGLGDKFSTFTLYKSVPTFQAINFDGDNNLTNSSQVVDLYKFSLKSDPAGPTAFYKVSFLVDPTNVFIPSSTYHLYESTSPSTLGNIVSGPMDMNVSGSGQLHFVDTYLDINDDNPNPGREHRIITAGATKYYTLRATVSGVDGTPDNGNQVSTLMLFDENFAGTQPLNAAGVDSTEQNDFIWSDLNYDLYSTTTSPNNEGWFSGYRLWGMDGATSSSQIVSD